jgi:hypothetical protein
MHRRLVHRSLGLVADGGHRFEIGDHGVKIAGREHLVERERHDRREWMAVRMYTVLQ